MFTKCRSSFEKASLPSPTALLEWGRRNDGRLAGKKD
jgi:hypothetical protein